MNTPPAKNPIDKTAAIAAAPLPAAESRSCAGRRSEKKLAAIMMPAATPCIALSMRLLNLFEKNTTDAPSVVIRYVNPVANKACTAAGRPIQNSTGFSSVKYPLYSLFGYFAECAASNE